MGGPVQVPLLDFDKVAKAEFIALRLPVLAKLCTEWDEGCAVKIAEWLIDSDSQIRRLKAGLAIPHPINPTYHPTYDLADHSLRSNEELEVLGKLSHKDLWDSVASGHLGEYLISIREMLSPSAEFRTGVSGTSRDSKGQSVRYPSHLHIAPQIARLTEWLKRNADYPIGCAPVAMNAIFNINPFADRNGRTGRILFNLICRSIGSGTFVPLAELAVMSHGEFTLRLRLAQYRSHWQPLLEYIDSSAKYVKKCIVLT